MLFSTRICLLIFIFSLSACGGGGSDSSGVVCTLPCLAESPTLSETTISSATGGTVTIQFKLTNDAENVLVVLASENPLNLNTAGFGNLANVQGGIVNQIDIVVNAGTTSDTYYPNISVTANQMNSGSLYYLDPTKSGNRYTYNEVITGNAGSPRLSSFTIPKLVVN